MNANLSSTTLNARRSFTRILLVAMGIGAASTLHGCVFVSGGGGCHWNGGGHWHGGHCNAADQRAPIEGSASAMISLDDADQAAPSKGVA